MENIEGSGVKPQNLWNRAENFCRRLFGLIKGISDEDKEKIISGLKVLLQDGDDNLLEKGLTKAAVDGKKYGTVVIPSDKIKNLLDPSLIEKLSALKGKKILLGLEEYPSRRYDSKIYIKIVKINESGDLTIKVGDGFEDLVDSSVEEVLNKFIRKFDTNLPPTNKEVIFDERRGCIKEVSKYVLSEMRDVIESKNDIEFITAFNDFIKKNQKFLEGWSSKSKIDDNENTKRSFIFDTRLRDFVLIIEKWNTNIKHL